MKLKYFLRGLGSGIVFASIIIMVGYMTSGSYKTKMTEKEIIKEAQKLGMVMPEQEETSSENVSTEDTEETMVTEATSEEITTEDASETEDTTEELSTEEETTEETTESTTEEVITEDESGEYTTAKIEVTRGMDSQRIAGLLQDAGIIKDAADFDKYLNQNGYATQLKINSYEFNSKMSYEDIAKELIKEDAE